MQKNKTDVLKAMRSIAKKLAVTSLAVVVSGSSTVNAQSRNTGNIYKVPSEQGEGFCYIFPTENGIVLRRNETEAVNAATPFFDPTVVLCEAGFEEALRAVGFDLQVIRIQRDSNISRSAGNIYKVQSEQGEGFCYVTPTEKGVEVYDNEADAVTAAIPLFDPVIVFHETGFENALRAANFDRHILEIQRSVITKD